MTAEEAAALKRFVAALKVVQKNTTHKLGVPVALTLLTVMIEDGLPVKEIADKAGTAENTASNTLKNTFAKKWRFITQEDNGDFTQSSLTKSGEALRNQIILSLTGR